MGPILKSTPWLPIAERWTLLFRNSSKAWNNYLRPMAKDHRYRTVRVMLNARGGIKSFKEIFKILPRSVMAQNMHTNNNRFYRLVLNPGDFTINEIRQMARLIGCKYEKLRDLVEKG